MFQILIAAHQPPYELRYNQVESMFLSAISGISFEAEKLEQLIKSGTSIFDILPSFFYHKNRLVGVAALEVSLRTSHCVWVCVSAVQLISGGQSLSTCWPCGIIPPSSLSSTPPLSLPLSFPLSLPPSSLLPYRLGYTPCWHWPTRSNH